MSEATRPPGVWARRHRVTVRRDQYKFSCAHMTVFPDGTKERLHGHNYQLGLELELTDVAFARMLPFAAVKECLAQLCLELRERVLIAEHNPLTTIVRAEAAEVELTVCGRRYVLPREDVLLLPVDNISVEALAAYLGDRVVAALAPSLEPGLVSALELWVSESPGQGSTCRLELEG
jgi:6-pyruvoyltetrahydropterin/6-carboxytetrahydropterin synthase